MGSEKNLHSVLFVCTGNICRSPMAEGMLRAACVARDIGANWRIDSAGIHASRGRPPEPNAVAVAAKYGADISALSARPFTLEDFRQFDEIVALDYGHLEFLLATAPANYAGNIALFAHDDGRAIEVADPYGQSRSVYQRAATLIDVGIHSLVRRLSAAVK